MKFILKIAVIPFVVAFSILSAVMKFFAWLSGRIFAVISLLLGIGGGVLLFNSDISAGIALLIIAFCVSPFGLPAIADGLVRLLDSANDSLKYFIAT